jgi:hypothetical protein
MEDNKWQQIVDPFETKKQIVDPFVKKEILTIKDPFEEDIGVGENIYRTVGAVRDLSSRSCRFFCLGRIKITNCYSSRIS